MWISHVGRLVTGQVTRLGVLTGDSIHRGDIGHAGVLLHPFDGEHECFTISLFGRQIGDIAQYKIKKSFSRYPRHLEKL